jgi:vancomycin resistance protein YoaR
MARSVRESSQFASPERVRREELIRTATRRRDFPRREAQRRLQQKEARWAPIAYGIFLAAVALIFSVTYTAFAFSKYRGVILPAVFVDKTSLSGMTSSQAYKQIDAKLAAIYGVPLRLQFQNHTWDPTRQQIGLQYDIQGTVNEAEAIGRDGPFLSNLIDRLPIHPTHEVPLLYKLNEARLGAYLNRVVAPIVFHRSANAGLGVSHTTWHVVLYHSHAGTQLDVANSEQEAHDALGSLSKQVRTLKVVHVPPVVTDADAAKVQTHVEAFLSHPPVMQIGKRVFVGSRYSFARMIHFSTKFGKHSAAIQMTVDSNAIHAYVSWLAYSVDRAPKNALLDFSAGRVTQIKPRRTGRTLAQDTAYSKILAAVSSLTPTARLRLPVVVTQPPFDQTNPGSLGISTLLAAGSTSFQGASSVRTDAVSTIAGTLNNVVVTPNEDISFNQLVQTPNGWADQAYADSEAASAGQPVPGDGGAMQQVATTFLRALYKAGLQLTERHAHRFRLPWYEPPYGFDALVNPARSWDLVFHNNTGKYLILQTRVEPIRQELFIYVFGPRLGWKVAVDSFGRLSNVAKHGPPVERVDQSLAPQERKQVAWASDGGTTVLQRTITFPNGNVKVDEIDTVYDPRAAVMAIGPAAATATPIPTITPTLTAKAKAKLTSSPSLTTTPQATPSPTFSH